MKEIKNNPEPAVEVMKESEKLEWGKSYCRAARNQTEVPLELETV